MSDHLDAEQDSNAANFVPPTPEELAGMLPQCTIYQLVAYGGMGAVYRGLQTDLDRPVAIKILPPEAGDDAESLNRFRSEARAMAKLNHNNIVSIYDFGAVQGQCYFIMEYVEGSNLHELIATGKIAPAQALEILNQICEALTYAHGKGIVHGDIKPSNIMLDADRRVKLLDFGLARLMEHGASQDDENWTPMGTPEYAAPELYDRSVKPDHRADIYAVGVILYEMLTGKVPQGSYALPTTIVSVDSRVDDIVMRCLTPEPEGRYQTAAEIRQVLEDIRTGKPAAPVDEKAPPRKPVARQAIRQRPPGRRRSGPVTGAMASRGAPRPLSVAGMAPATPNPAGPPAGRRAAPVTTTTARAAVDRLRSLEAQQKSQKDKQMKMIIGGALALVAAIIVVIVAMNLLNDGGEKEEHSGKGAGKDSSGKDSRPPPQPRAPEPAQPPKNPPATVAHETPKPPPTPPPDKTPKPEVKPEQPPTPPPATAETNKEPGKTPAPPSTPGTPMPGQPDPVITQIEPFPSLAKLRGDFVQRYKAEVQQKVEADIKDLGDKYLQGLTRLEQDFLTRNDAGSVLQVRTEKDRFEQQRTPPAGETISRNNEKLANAQRILTTAIDAKKKSVAPRAKALNSEFSEALLRLVNTLLGERKPEEAAAAKETREEVIKGPDFLGGATGFSAPTAVAAVIEDGNVALATAGATADALRNASGLIDGVKEGGAENSALGVTGTYMTVTLAKVYKLERIRIFLPEKEHTRFNYYLEVSPDGAKWNMQEDRTKGEWRGTQDIGFKPIAVKAFRIKITGVEGMERFVVRETEAYCEGKSGEAKK